MLKVNFVERWDSTGNEFIEKLKEKGIDYKIVCEGLEVFKLTNPGVAGGKKFDIIEYTRPSNGKRVLIANGAFGLRDWVIEEIYGFDLEDSQEYTLEEVAEAIRNYIIKENERERDEENQREKLRIIISDEVREVAKTLIGEIYKLDFEIPCKYMNIETNITDVIKSRLESRKVIPIKIESFYFPSKGKNKIVFEISFNIVNQITTMFIYVNFDIQDNYILIKNAY